MSDICLVNLVMVACQLSIVYLFLPIRVLSEGTFNPNLLMMLDASLMDDGWWELHALLRCTKRVNPRI